MVKSQRLEHIVHTLVATVHLVCGRMTREGTIADNVTAKAVLKIPGICEAVLCSHLHLENKSNNEVPNIFNRGSDTLNSFLLGEKTNSSTVHQFDSLVD